MHQTVIPYYREVDYHDPEHRYFLDDWTYLSATQAIHHFKQEFDPEEESKRMAEQHGMTQQYWLDKWSAKTKRSNTRGNKLHNAKEDFLYGRGFDTVDGKHYEVRNRNLYPRNIQYLQLPDGVYPELKLWRHDYRIAGRSDKIIIRTGGNPGSLFMSQINWPHSVYPPYRYMDVEDYKTNQRIRKESFYYRDEQGNKVYKMMKGPLAHLMDCEWNWYSLQFSLYQFMGEYHGFLPGKRRMIFFRNDEEVYDGLLMDLPGETPPVIEELPYLRDEVIAMLEYLKQEKEAA